jgi:hypothetical protein
LAQITNPIKVLNSISPRSYIRAIVQAVIIFALSQRHDVWPVAVVFIVVAEVGLLRPRGKLNWPELARLLLKRVPVILLGVSGALIIAVIPRFASQIALALIYGTIRVFWTREMTGPRAWRGFWL